MPCRRILSVRPTKDIKSLANEAAVHEDLIQFVAKQQQTIGNGTGRRRSPTGTVVWEAEPENTYHDENTIAMTNGAEGQHKSMTYQSV